MRIFMHDVDLTLVGNLAAGCRRVGDATLLCVALADRVVGKVPLARCNCWDFVYPESTIPTPHGFLLREVARKASRYLP